MSSPFVIQCSRQIFCEAWTAILEDHGARLERLADGRQPSSAAGRRFVEVANGRRQLKIVYGKLWVM